MTAGGAAVVEVGGLSKRYGGLRPLRLERLVVREGERVALGGLDAAAAETLTSLLTGAALPDEGVVRVFGEPTADIADERAWLASLDRFGIVSPRAVLLSASTLAQNLAIPFTLEIEPVPAPVMDRVRALAAEIGLDEGLLDTTAGGAPPGAQARIHLARAVAHGPRLVIVEHPTAMVPPGDGPALAADLARVAGARGFAVLAMTGDPAFASALGGRHLTLDPASGRLAEAGGWRRWLGR
jgi:branched-chain amino acid transport system ATP-binding protein